MHPQAPLMLPITMGEERKSTKPCKKWPNASLRSQDLRKRPCGGRRGAQREERGAGEGGSRSDRKSWAEEPWESHSHSHVHANLL